MKTITLTKEQKKYIKHYAEKEEDVEIAFNVVLKMLGRTKKELWDELHNMYPEIRDKYATFDHKKSTIKYRDEEVL